jgi:hypothetical protein
LTPSIVAQYETLRRVALGELLPPEARSGLSLFLRQGLWGWARVQAVASEGEQPTGSPSSGSTAPHPNKAVVQVFAALALNGNRRAQ